MEQSELLAGGVVLCKDWQWAALTLLAAWLLLCTCPCAPPDDLLCDPRLIFTAHDGEWVMVKEAKNPLLDDEEEKENDEELLGTASMEQKLLDRGASIDELLTTSMHAAETELRERGDTASCADRERFVRICLSVQAIFLDVLPSWPWHPGEQERMEPVARAEKGRQCIEAFRNWMKSCRTAEAAREEEASQRFTGRRESDGHR